MITPITEFEPPRSPRRPTKALHLDPQPKKHYSLSREDASHSSETSFQRTAHNMNSPHDMSPTQGPTQLAAGHAPPTPPHEDPLDDIYGSAPSSPVNEMLSDLPSRQRALDNDAYREGLAQSKGQYVQAGFDEGYSLGANLGLRVGYILGVLQGFVAAWKGHDAVLYRETKDVFEQAKTELAIEELLGEKWVDGEGLWKWDVEGEEEKGFRVVADAHPVVVRWMGRVQDMARRWGVDMRAVERSLGDDEGTGEAES
ncbi:hypothetical protein P153DRAFT_429277 [Dothidotthia symphoricarpi CBS 119687]|uniref:Protein YAE1 n=1 Tax=Dothidotthia symphoricarpi CBS 119687 TaxID=1392245 RepID=A0A6A6ALS6_9PLEO|nr:uncharacterized protein P153DRAFT_429277 [Dothidotthia symphoricarpi CBS 119687]KAF2132078.1 hypothetical protein P153DRAFT_429277 [Dothidotthia symphoricarpi CBS 119687]